ncbi:tyrosine-type recombinase/integrase [Amycolatopsis sp. NPDC051373]|uniref:tyrosine-type recombinase/integrase n=1 Tax=Amycolatopsis sp. NPDC051373 TaxID=3155801 RepID=UPI00344B46F9
MAWAEPMPGGGFRGRYRLPNGTKHTVLQPDGTAFPTKPKAKKAAIAAEVEGQRKAPVVKKTASAIPASILWGDWWDRLVLDRPFAESGTAGVEATIVRRHLRPYWGDVPLNRIITSNPDLAAGEVGIQEWVDSPSGLATRKGMSPNYAIRVFGVFSVSMQAACKENILDTPPTTGVKLPKVYRRKRPALTPTAVSSLKMRDDYEELLRFATHTGLRPGELCGLHAHHCDLDRGIVTVAEVLVERRKIIRAFPKDDDHRDVPLTPVALEILKKRLEGRDLSGKCPFSHFNGATCHSPLVFMSAWNRPYMPHSVSESMKLAAGRQQLMNTGGMYSTRHGFGTTAADNGLNVFEVADIMGHSKLETTRQYYQGSGKVRERLSEAFRDQ